MKAATGLLGALPFLITCIVAIQFISQVVVVVILGEIVVI
jgi:hypothetical protein